MQQFRFLGLVLFAALSAVPARAAVTPVGYVDPARFAGTWYVAAGAAVLGSPVCFCTQADFAPVTTQFTASLSCRRGGVTGSVLSIPGTARITDPTSNAKLRIVFPVFGELNINIAALAPDYQHAVLIDDKGEQVLVLSRERVMNPTALEDALRVAREQAPAATVQKVVQEGC